ncbi:constitutive coactivator of peroxisome proliferator-activated receptor gamma [Anabrus simplex]|uniref:constitutive coactivator of peroxisome proliferator-activated receptor gamma n=1 Tax=Anabrus simplex TaxID=316456 RepID=UPI0035A2D973
MGVRGLQTFIERDCPAAWSVVSVKDIADNFRLQTGRNATVVVDGNSCLRAIYGGLDWVHGGQYKQYIEKLTDFINFFTRLKISLVFFFDGPTVERKRPVWCERREAAQRDIEMIYQLLHSGTNVSEIPSRLFQIPAGIGLATRIFLKTHPQCTVFTTVQECDEEVVQFAVQNQCFAILGQDSDYIIHEGTYYYMSINHLDIRRGTTYIYNRFALARELRIEPFALPLLASLVGNDIISKAQLSDFHFGLFNRHPRNRELFFAVADFIRHFRDENDIWRSLPHICKDVFASEFCFGRTNYVPLLESSLLSYKPFSGTASGENVERPLESWSVIVQTAKELMKSNVLMTAVYGVVADHTFELSASLEDRQCNRFPSIAVHYLALRKRTYGVLLEQCSTRMPVIFEYCANKNKHLQREEVLADPVPHGLHPGLLTLWDKTLNTPAIDRRRWSLFVWGLTGSLQLPIERLMYLPLKLVAVVAICHYFTLAQPQFLEEWEIYSLLVQTLKLHVLGTEDLRSLRVPPTNLRCLNIAAMFLRGIQHVIFLANAVGLPVPDSELSPVNVFDGILFHKVYTDTKNGIPFSRQIRHQASEDLLTEMASLTFSRS